MKNKIKFFINVVRTYKNWITVLLDHLNFFPMYSVNIYKLRNGVKFKTRAQTSDLGVIHRIFFGKENEEFLDRLSKKPVITDIGAHIGAVSIYIAGKFPNTKIYGYEPFPENYAFPQENAKINVLNNIKTC